MKKFFVVAALAVSTLPFAAYADTPQENRRDRYADRVERAFERDAVLARFDLDADSKGERTGYIQLEGRVRNTSQRNRALAMARRVAPSYRIVNLIRISPRAGRYED